MQQQLLCWSQVQALLTRVSRTFGRAATIMPLRWQQQKQLRCRAIRVRVMCISMNRSICSTSSTVALHRTVVTGMTGEAQHSLSQSST